MRKSQLIHALALGGHIRILLAETTALTEEARLYHHLQPTSLAALGRILAVTAILGATLKDEKAHVSVQLNGNGPAGNVYAEAYGNGDVRGYISDPSLYLVNKQNKLAVEEAIGKKGFLRVTKDLGLKQNFTSEVALQSGEIGDDFAYYFSVSEQLPALVSVGVLVGPKRECLSSGALIIEMMPGHDEEDIQKVEALQKQLKPISTLIREKEDLPAFVLSLFPDVQILATQALRYHCRCSREHFLKVLKALNKKDRQELLTDEELTIRCEFCNKVYHFKREEFES